MSIGRICGRRVNISIRPTLASGVYVPPFLLKVGRHTQQPHQKVRRPRNSTFRCYSECWLDHVCEMCDGTTTETDELHHLQNIRVYTTKIEHRVDSVCVNFDHNTTPKIIIIIIISKRGRVEIHHTSPRYRYSTYNHHTSYLNQYFVSFRKLRISA